MTYDDWKTATPPEYDLLGDEDYPEPREPFEEGPTVPLPPQSMADLIEEREERAMAIEYHLADLVEELRLRRERCDRGWDDYVPNCDACRTMYTENGPCLCESYAEGVLAYLRKEDERLGVTS